MLRAVTYGRVSTHEQVQHGYSLPDQPRVLTELCERQGWRHIEHVDDAGVSGVLIDRPGIRRVRELAEARAFDVLVALKLDRLSRRAWAAAHLIDWLRDRAVEVRFLEHVSGDTPQERLLLTMLGGIAEFEHSEIATKTRAGRAAKARAGKVPCGRTPCGYRMVTVAEAAVLPEFAGRDGELLLTERAAEVREMFERVAAGASLRAVCRWLNDAGSRTERGVLWQSETLSRLLANPCYYGEYQWGRTACRQSDTRTFSSGRPYIARKPRPEDERIVVPCPAIVSRELWDQVQSRLAENAAQAGRPSLVWMLKGCVFCAACRSAAGKPLPCRGDRKSRNPARGSYFDRYYRCSSYSRLGDQDCGTLVRADTLERLAVRELRRIAEADWLAEKAREHAALAWEAAGDLPRAAGEMRRALARLEAEERRLLALVRRGLGGRLVDAELGSLQAQRRQAEERLAQAEAKASRLLEPQEAARRGEEQASRLRARLADADGDAAGMQDLCRLFLRITLAKGKRPLIEVPIERILAETNPA